MAARALTYYLDASIQIGVAQGLDLVRADIMFPGKPGCPIASPTVKDHIWLPIVGANDWVVIMRDKHIRTRPGERQALMQAGVRAFCLTGAGNYSKWQTLDLLVRRWDAVASTAIANPGPYIYAVTYQGLALLP